MLEGKLPASNQRQWGRCMCCSSSSTFAARITCHIQRRTSMDSSSDAQEEYAVRRFVYDHFLSTGQSPTIAGTALALSQDPAAIRDIFRRLAAGRILVLQDNEEILMANPFSA